MNQFKGEQGGWVKARKCVLLAVLLAGGQACATTVVQTFSYTTPLTADPSNPSFSEIFNITLWGSRPEFNGNSSLTAVTVSMTSEIRYEGDLISVLASQNYTLQISSDFNFSLNGNTIAAGLDPVITHTGTSPSTALTPFIVPPVGQLTDTENGSSSQSPALFLGTGTIPFQVTGTLLASGPGGYHNLTANGPASPFVFLNNGKVYTVEQAQLFQLHTSVSVTYTVPEASPWAAGLAAAGAGAVVIGFRRWRRSKT